MLEHGTGIPQNVHAKPWSCNNRSCFLFLSSFSRSRSIVCPNRIFKNKVCSKRPVPFLGFRFVQFLLRLSKVWRYDLVLPWPHICKARRGVLSHTYVYYRTTFHLNTIMDSKPHVVDYSWGCSLVIRQIKRASGTFWRPSKGTQTHSECLHWDFVFIFALIFFINNGRHVLRVQCTARALHVYFS